MLKTKKEKLFFQTNNKVNKSAQEKLFTQTLTT